MNVTLAYLTVLMIWSSTPLAIAWSAQAGFLFSVTMRLALGALLVLIFALARGINLDWSSRNRPLYLISGLSIFLSMLCVYWASLHIPSGWISVVFGTFPLLTLVLSILVLGDRELSLVQVSGLLLGLAGLSLVCLNSRAMGPDALQGICTVLVGTGFQALGAVLLKRYNHSLSGMEINVGGLLVAIPCFVVVGVFADIDWNPVMEKRAAWAILYLATVATALGFSLYFFLLRHVSPLRLSLMSLVTPFITLLLGHWLNQEALSGQVWVGAGLIGTGLLLVEFRRLRLGTA